MKGDEQNVFLVILIMFLHILYVLQIDEQLVQSSGKFLILDRLLPALKTRGHKVKQEDTSTHWRINLVLQINQ